MLDFHSTNRNLFYVQGDEATPQGKAFLAGWLGAKETAFKGYPFEIEPRDANPGSGTTKNWFHATYGIPAFTYEAGDNTDAAAIRTAAEALAASMIPALSSSLGDAPGQ
jgi:predicted deacylase